MSRKTRVRIGALGVCAAAFCSAGVSSCGAGSSSVTVSGSTLSIYLSAPRAPSPAAQDVLDAEQLAFQQLGSGKTGKFNLKLVKVSGAELSDNARAAIQNTGAVAYLGELAPGSSSDSLGITNAQDLLQVSPTDTALELTQSTPAISKTPDRYYESLSTYGRTFARVVPSTEQEARAQVQEMVSLRIKRLYVASDGSQYGRAIAAAVSTAAPPRITIASSASAADGMFYGGSNQAAAAQAFAGAQSSTPALKLFAPSALADLTFAARLGAATRNLYISVPGFLPGQLTASGRTFRSDFQKTYGHAPSTQAIFGYAAMQGVLYALQQSGGSANDRASVVKNFFAIRNFPSVVGSYSINSNGDTSIAPFVFYRLKAGALVPLR